MNLKKVYGGTELGEASEKVTPARELYGKGREVIYSAVSIKTRDKQDNLGLRAQTAMNRHQESLNGNRRISISFPSRMHVCVT